MARGDLTDQQWQRLEPHLPPRKPKRGRPNRDHRRIINGILWIDRTGAPGATFPRNTARGGRWRAASNAGRRPGCGIEYSKLSKAKKTKWESSIGRSTTWMRPRSGPIGTPQGQKGDPKEEALGPSRGAFSTKTHIRAQGSGKPMAFFLSEGQRDEMVGFLPLMEDGEVERAGRGRARLRPRRICADEGYAKGAVRCYLRRLGIRITIARRSNEHRGGPFDRAIYRTRNLVERLINRLKHFRRVATRYEKRAENYEAMLKIVAITIWP